MAERLDRYDTVPAQLIKSVEGISPQLLNELLSRINLDVSGGQIVRSEANMRAILAVVGEFQDWLLDPESSPYYASVKSYIDEFSVQRELSAAVIRSFGEVPAASEVVWRTGRSQAINALVGDQMKSEFIQAIRSTMVESVSSARSFPEMVRALTTVVQGNDRINGRLLNWTKQVAHDRFAIADRAFTQTAAEELGVEWFAYNGGRIPTSRCFCVERNGGYYHINEIKSWGRLENLGNCRTDNGWAGRIDNTDSQTIRLYLGGYNCNHSLVPVSPSIIPETTLQLAINNGFWSPTDATKKRLGLV